MTTSATTETWELVAVTLESVLARLEMGYGSMSEEQREMMVPSLFDSSIVPDITIHDYVAHFHRHTECSDSCYTLTFIYIDLALMLNPGLVLSMRSIHRLFIASMILAIKFLDDRRINNMLCSSIGGIPLLELNWLEIEMLNLLHYDLYVDTQLYQQYLGELNNHTQPTVQVIEQELMVINYQEKFSRRVNPHRSGKRKTSSLSNNLVKS